jgi:hypothetical protein
VTPVHTQPVAGRWRLGERLGRGAVADVYDATDETTGERVAVKVLREADDGQRARLDVELAALEALDHPGIVGVRGHGELDGCPYLVLECVDGGSLADALATSGPTSPERAAAVGAALAEALDHAHAHGIVHRDVKPSNVLLDGGDRPRLADFGVARVDGGEGLTATGFTVGTAAYLAPEQVRGEPVGPAADVYSLGLVVLELLTGTRAFPGSGLTAAVARLEGPPDVPPDVPAPLATQLRAMTAMDPTERPSARAVAAALAVLADGTATDGTAVLPVVDDATEAIAVAGPVAAAPVAGPVAAAPAVARRSNLPGWVVPLACFVVGFLVVLAIRAAASGDGLDAPAPASTTATTTAPTTTAPPPPTTAPPTTAPPDDDGGDGEEGGGRGRDNGRGRGGDDD